MSHGPMAVLVPWHGWEDFPSHYRGDEATQILAGWTTLWHPVLLDYAGRLPEWRHFRHRSDPQASLRLVPRVAGIGPDEIPPDGPSFEMPHSPVRSEIVAELVSRLGLNCPPGRDELVSQFHALGYATLQVQLMTRQMRHSCGLDEHRFSEVIVAAARAFMQGDIGEVTTQIRLAFDQLAQERDHYYAVDVFLLEIVLAVPQLAEHLSGSLFGDSGRVRNLLITGETLERWVRHDPLGVDALARLISNGSLGLIGGEPFEERLPLLPADTLLDHLRRGVKQFREILGVVPHVFGRRAFGLAISLPEVLKRLDYRGALHFNLDEGKLPPIHQAKTVWQGTSSSSLDVIAKMPSDGAAAETFLYLATQLSQSMDGDHVATALFAHWPGTVAPWLNDLRIATDIHPVLGRFVTVDEYFERSSHGWHHDRYRADQYRSPYLTQDLRNHRTDPITFNIRSWEQDRVHTAVQHLETLSVLVGGSSDSRDSTDASPTTDVLDPYARFSRVLTGPTSTDNAKGWLLANPFAIPQRVLVEIPQFEGHQLASDAVLASGRQGGRFYAVVDVSSCGFVWLPGADTTQSSGEVGQLPNIASGEILQNEHMRVTIDARTGGIGSLRDYQHRDNLLTQQLAYRFRDSAAESVGSTATVGPVVYTRMVADQMEVVATGSVWGCIETRGKLLDVHGGALGGFRQRTTLWRGSRTLWLDIELEPSDRCREEMAASAGETYTALRLAWRDAGAALYRDVHMTRQPTEVSRFEAPGYVAIETGLRRATLLCRGIPYHRRSGDRMLDTLLLAGAEQTRRFRFGIALDAKSPWQEDVSGLVGLPFDEPTSPHLVRSHPPQGQSHAWLIHVDVRNVWLSDLTPVLGSQGECTGIRARLLETEGQSSTVRVLGFRPIQQARILDLVGNCTSTGSVQDGVLTVPMGAHEWLGVEILWS